MQACRICELQTAVPVAADKKESGRTVCFKRAVFKNMFPELKAAEKAKLNVHFILPCALRASRTYTQEIHVWPNLTGDDTLGGYELSNLRREGI